MKVAVFPGTFDPLTLGHLDLIKRGSALFDQLAVAVMTNRSKKPLFTVEERVAQIITNDGLTVDLMNRIGADYLMRGLRNTTDFQYERDIAAMNNFLDDQCETVFFLAKPEYQHLSSSILKEVTSSGGDISAYLPKNINEALKQRIEEEKLKQVKEHNEKTR